ncbi:DUF2306 domain-containing protein [Thalassotalea euphylliae]|uniref:DUF2306 domain-containing protein n=1 Tax=Thalassotalea euphylliae TaxID=1655234 RepID=UPI003630C0E2
MTLANTAKLSSEKPTISFNWTVVGSLFFLMAIPAIPAMFFITAVALGPSVIGELTAYVSAAHFEKPAALFVHGGSGVLFFLSMPFQFSPKLRASHLNWHKMSGRIAVVSGYVMAISGVWMHNVLTPESQGGRYFSLIVMSIAMCLTFSIALWHIINKRVSAHQKWMARAVAVTLAAVTPLFVDILILLVFGSFNGVFDMLVDLHHNYGRLLAIVINLSVVEFWFNRKKQTGQ